MHIIHLVISLFFLIIILISQPAEVLARAPMRFDYVGVELCKLCHKKKELGNQFDVWTNTHHSKAFYTLGTPEAKEVAVKAGIKDPQQNNKCLRCHSTAYAFTEEKVAEDLLVEEGVQCESCHGPGEEYMYAEVMENLEDAKDMGLIIPTEDTCRKCHNPESPTWDPEKDITPDGKRVGFYFPLRWKMIEHHNH